jgi:hypothetical protein
MISATDALALPTAQLPPDEMEAANKLEAEIEVHLLAKMTRAGVNFDTAEMRATVIAEVNQRFRAAGYQTQWSPKTEQHKIYNNRIVHVGFSLSLFPTDEAYRAAARSSLI